MFMFDKYAGGSQTGTCKVEFEIFHVLGCPEQEPRLVLPQALTVDYPNTLTTSVLANFDVTVTAGAQPVAGARVCLLLEPTEFYVGITDTQGKVHFEFTPTSSGDIQVTVTHKDVLPFEGKVSVSSLVPPTVVSIAPSSGNFSVNTWYTFTTVYSDANGYKDIKSADLIINSSPVSGAFYVQYRQDLNKLYIYSGATAYGGYAPGSNINVGTTYGVLNCLQTTVSGSGNNLTISWKVMLYNALGGTKNLYLSAQDMSNLSSNWQQKGAINISAAPTIVSLSPSSGTFKPNTAYTFTAVHSDANGLEDIKSANFLVNTNSNTTGAFFAHYRRDQRLLFLYNGTTQVGGYAPGSNNTIETPYGWLYCNQTTVSGSGNNLTIGWRVNFKPTILGTEKVYLSSTDMSNLSSGTVQKGTITIDNPPTIVSLSPSSGTFNTNANYTFSTVYSDADGYANLKSANFFLNTAATTTGAFFAHYRRDQNLLFLYNGTTQVGGYVPGSANVIETPYGKLYCNQTTVSGSGNNLTINWRVSLNSTMLGTKYAYMSCGDMYGVSSSTINKGTIFVNEPPEVVSLSPSTGTFNIMAPYTFSTVFSDPNGFSDLNIMYILINTSTSSTNALYACYHRGNNQLWLWDGAKFIGGSGYTPGSSGVIETTFGKLYCAGTSVIGSGSNLTINWSLGFKTTGTKNVYLWAYDSRSAYTGWKQKGTITVNPFVMSSQ
jgi:hypothetical protein